MWDRKLLKVRRAACPHSVLLAVLRVQVTQVRVQDEQPMSVSLKLPTDHADGPENLGVVIQNGPRKAVPIVPLGNAGTKRSRPLLRTGWYGIRSFTRRTQLISTQWLAHNLGTAADLVARSAAET